MENQNFMEIFPVGTEVECQTEAHPGKWVPGTVLAHEECRELVRDERITCSIRIETEEMIVEYSYSYLDSDPENSLVRVVKAQ